MTATWLMLKQSVRDIRKNKNFSKFLKISCTGFGLFPAWKMPQIFDKKIAWVCLGKLDRKFDVLLLRHKNIKELKYTLKRFRMA